LIETKRPAITTAAPFFSETLLTGSGAELQREAWLEAALFAVDSAARIVHSAASILPDVKTLISVFIFMLCSGALIGVVAATLFTAYAAYAACKRSTTRFVQNVERAIADIDRVAAEAERQMTSFRKTMQEVNSTLNKEVEEARKAIQSHAESVAERISDNDIQLEVTSNRARGSLDALNHAISKIQDEFLPFPTKDELLAKDLKVYRDSLAAARDEILEEAEEVKRLVPRFERKFQATVADLTKDKLGELPKILGDEKKRLREAVKALREAHNALPALGDLEKQAQHTRQEVLDMESSLQKASAESAAALARVPELRNQIEKEAQQTREEFLEMKSSMKCSLQKASAESTAVMAQVPDLRNHLEKVQVSLFLRFPMCKYPRDFTAVQSQFPRCSLPRLKRLILPRRRSSGSRRTLQAPA
jgi:gas vesicle protein